MYFGHYGIGLLLKRFAKRISLGWLFFAVNFVDILAAIFGLLGIESANVVPGFAPASSLEFVYIPFSHSFVSFLVFAGVFYGVFRLIQVKPGLEKSKVALVMGLAVLSHLILDLITHISDMPLLGDDSVKLGLGLWNYHPFVSYIAEGFVLLSGLFIYFKSTKSSNSIGKFGMVFVVAALFVLNIMFTFFPLPSDIHLIAVLGLAFYGIITLSGFWLDTKRNSNIPSRKGNSNQVLR